MHERRAQQRSDSNGAHKQPAVGAAAAHIAATGRHAEISSDSADVDNAIPWMPPKAPLWSKPLSGLGRRSKSVPRKTRRSVVEYGPLALILPNPINLESILGNKSKRSLTASKLLASTPRFWSTAKSELSLAMLDWKRLGCLGFRKSPSSGLTI